jgi:hypothetical protein
LGRAPWLVISILKKSDPNPQSWTSHLGRNKNLILNFF